MPCSVPERRPAPLVAPRARRPAGRTARLLPLLGLLTALGVLTAAPAAAHDQLLSADPPADAVLTAPPAAVSLSFSAELLDISATVLVDGPAGPVEVTAPTVVGKQVTAALPADLPNGPYVVTWRVVSGDGHPIQGTYDFTLEAPSPISTPTSTPTATTTAPVTPTPTDPAVLPTMPEQRTGGSPLATGVVSLLAVVTAAVVLIERRVRRRTPPGDPR